ncbi:hypothetical protein D1610_07140 [Sphingomonas gilva]|uniref:Uncharacterized protein n=2 Tax=Sphingomonas gilva TaxID=2305907 RepID=A0A396RUV7_9SPHN|nr:hypothetical protein D1610_07140 [Sphingomonas gilva]
MAGNFAVIEVKCEHAGKAGIAKDLETLSFFVNEFGYQRAIYLIYGDADPRASPGCRSEHGESRRD